jgi:hypothetical protein
MLRVESGEIPHVYKKIQTPFLIREWHRLLRFFQSLSINRQVSGLAPCLRFGSLSDLDKNSRYDMKTMLIISGRRSGNIFNFLLLARRAVTGGFIFYRINYCAQAKTLTADNTLKL